MKRCETVRETSKVGYPEEEKASLGGGGLLRQVLRDFDTHNNSNDDENNDTDPEADPALLPGSSGRGDSLLSVLHSRRVGKSEEVFVESGGLTLAPYQR